MAFPFWDFNSNGTTIQHRALRLGFLLMLLAGCKGESLDPLQKAMSGVYNYGTAEVHFCTSAPSPAQQKLKYLFILDHSASNKPGITADPTDIQATDETGGRRYGPMVNFIRNLTVDPKTQTSFALIDFNDTAKQVDGLSGFDTDANDFITQASKDWVGGGDASHPSPLDAGFTNYEDALALAKQMIQEDAQAEAAVQTGTVITSVYQIVFVTDGVPTVQNSGGGPALYTQQFVTDLKPLIDDINSLKLNVSFGHFIANISLNTAYYFNTVQPPNAAASTLLQQMADDGNGLFIQFASGQQIMYQQFAPPSRNVLNNLADVFVENENAVWWDNGQFMLDTDGDGLPDAIEAQFGSNPNVRDSDGNGVSDLVEFRTKGMPCKDATCSQAGRDPYAMCAGYHPVTDAAGNVKFDVSSNDGLNDCEKFLLGGIVGSFDSVGQYIPDLLGFKNSLSIQSTAPTTALSDPFGDGLTNYSKIKAGLPIQVSKKAITDFDARESNLSVESTQANGVVCYHLTVQDLALTNAHNTLKVYVVQSPSSIQDKPFLMTAEKSVDGNLTATFGAGDFK